ncbi:MAG: hypothetical protein ACRENX_13190 [Candidatus Dormibacteria bacterium]
MQIPADAFLPPVRALLDELLRRGYAIGEERYDESSFGNALVILKRNDTVVRLVRDRGQWFVEVAGAAEGDWFAPVIWHAFLESSMPPLEATSLDGQAQLLLADLARIETTNSDFSEQDLAGLQTWRSRRAEARRAMPPTG